MIQLIVYNFFKIYYTIGIILITKKHPIQKCVVQLILEYSAIKCHTISILL